VLIAIADDGTGIAPEHLPHLFEPFYTTKPQGTGLGLAISAHIITQHGGGITVESEPGIGTTFRIVLPARPPGGHRA
jgi:two-component system NtrC family sensor kinase